MLRLGPTEQQQNVLLDFWLVVNTWTAPVVKDALGELETPGGKSIPGERVGTPLTDVIHRNLKVALANSSRNNNSDMQAISASPQLSKTTETEVNRVRIT